MVVTKSGASDLDDVVDVATKLAVDPRVVLVGIDVVPIAIDSGLVDPGSGELSIADSPAGRDPPVVDVADSCAEERSTAEQPRSGIKRNSHFETRIGDGALSRFLRQLVVK